MYIHVCHVMNSPNHATMTTNESTKEAALRLREARALRTSALSEDDLMEVEQTLEKLLSDLADHNATSLLEVHGHDEDTKDVWTDAGIFLATLLLQKDGDQSNISEISSLLSERNFCYRLSIAALTHNHDTQTKPPKRYAAAWDGILPDHLLKRLDMTFGPTSTFWERHNYSDGSGGKDPSQYFSYIVPLKYTNNKDDINSTALDAIIGCIRRQVSDIFPSVTECKYAEWWAHCRPHSSGHQLHFDSDDEGRGGVRNPVCSTVINLSANLDMGGETLVTTQTSTGRSLASKGWLCSNERNRLLAFRGDLLHGVVPGPRTAKIHGGTSDDEARSRRRVTFMVAFWEDIRIQDDEGHGTARAFSRVANEPWAKPLSENIEYQKVDAAAKGKDCFFEVPVWEDVDVEKNKQVGASVKEIRKYKLALPPYEDFFQFFS